MTKAGVGTATTTSNSNSSNIMTGQQGNSTATTPEIPIWVSDRKKWVTGISKKTTINDIIYAILKQCHINCEYESISDYVLVEIMYSLLNEDHHHYHQQQQQQQQNFVINSERVLKGNSKVYKYINKWIENSNKLILKVKKCELSLADDSSSAVTNTTNLNVSLSSASSSVDTNNHNTTLDTTITGAHSNNKDTNTITKFFKKLTNVNNSNSNSNNNTKNNNANTSITSSSTNSKHVVKYVDVKLPALQQQQAHMPQSHSQMFVNNAIVNQQQQQQQQTSTLTRVNKAGIVPIASLQQQQQQHKYQQNDFELDQHYDQPYQQQQQQQNKPSPSGLPLPYKQYDPTLQKTLIVTNILDKDKRLNQQFERVKLLDELIKEAEKTLIINENYYLSNQQFLENQQQQQQQFQQSSLTTNRPPVHNDFNLNDIYSCFPEMGTHGPNEVEEFQLMCKKLLSLDDNVQQQKQMLNKLEYDIQKELTMNNSQLNQLANANETLDDLLQISSTLAETPETVKLKKEVNLSREQTRVQCKELHDLDLRMRQNESVLLHKENELKSLLEELYLHEIYIDSVDNDAVDGNNKVATTPKTALITSTNSNTATNSKLKTLTGNAPSNNNNMLSSSSTSTASSASSSSSASLTPPIEHLVNKSNISTIVSAQQQLKQQQMSPAIPPPLPTTLPPSTPQTQQKKTSDHCDNDSGISSMSSENDHTKVGVQSASSSPYIHLQQQQQQQSQQQKSVMETLV